MRLPSLVTCILALACHPAVGSEPVVVYRGATVLTVTRGEIADADFVVRDGKFIAVGKRGKVAIPDGSVVHHLDGKIVLPGLVDTHSHIGIFPRPAVAAHADGNEMTGPVAGRHPGDRRHLAGRSGHPHGLSRRRHHRQHHARQRQRDRGPDPLCEATSRTDRQHAVQPGTPEGGLKMANGENPKRAYGAKNQAPGTRMSLAALQREQFVKARDYRRKWQAYRQAQEKARDAKTKDAAKANERPTGS